MKFKSIYPLPRITRIYTDNEYVHKHSRESEEAENDEGVSTGTIESLSVRIRVIRGDGLL